MKKSSSPVNYGNPMPYHGERRQPTFMSNVKDGFGLGVGVSLARNVVDSFFGPAKVTTVSSTPSSSDNLLKMKIEEYKKCMEQSNNDSEGCKHWLN